VPSPATKFLCRNTLYARSRIIIDSNMISSLIAVFLSQSRRAFPRCPFVANLVLGFAVLLVITGCQTQTAKPQLKEPTGQISSQTGSNQPNSLHSESIVLREGDTLKITFMGAPNLNTTVTIRRDGKIGLYLVGEVSAAGMTPGELEKELKKRYKDQIIVNEITVAVESDAITVYVTGAVMHPQKVLSNHPITVLEAVMEAGGPDYSKANLKAVTVLRQDAGHVNKIVLNLKDVLSGTTTEPLYLKNSDIIYIREKFSWF
jgi:polysaccharide export outer membrane protein